MLQTHKLTSHIRRLIVKLDRVTKLIEPFNIEGYSVEIDRLFKIRGQWSVFT